MVKGFKGLKRFGAFVLSLVMAASMAVTVAPEMKVKAATYEPLTGDKVPVKDWDFKSALNEDEIDKWPKNFDDGNQIAKETEFTFGTFGVHYYFPGGYKYTANGNDVRYDLHVKIKPKGKTEFFSGVAYKWNDFSIMRDNSSHDLYIGITFKRASGGNTRSSDAEFEWEIYLTQIADQANYRNSNGKGAVVDKKEVPFIAGNCYQGYREGFSPHSDNGIIYTNMNSRYGADYSDVKWEAQQGKRYASNGTPEANPYTFIDHSNGRTNESGVEYDSTANPIFQGYYVNTQLSMLGANNKNSDKDGCFIIATGYTPNNSVIGGYKAIEDGSRCELIVGYRVRPVKFAVFPGDGVGTPADGGFTFAVDGSSGLQKIGDEREYLELSVMNTAASGGYVPEIVDGNMEDNPANPGTKYTFKYWTTGQDVTLDDGTKILKGQVITEEQIKRIRIAGSVDYPDLIFYAHSTASQYVPPVTPTPEATPEPTPSGTPDNTDSDTSPSTGETIKVEFVTPIGNPPPTQIKHVGDKADDPGAPIDPATLKPGTIIDGHRFEGWYLDKGFTMPYNFDTKLPHSIVLYAKWVRVSPKTGDTTIPPVYYVFGALALAGVGALATKSRKLRK